MLRHSSSEQASQNKNAATETKNISAENKVTGSEENISAENKVADSEKYISPQSTAVKKESFHSNETIVATANNNPISENPVKENEAVKEESPVAFNATLSPGSVSAPVAVGHNAITDTSSIQENAFSANHPAMPQQTTDTAGNATVQSVPNNVVKPTADSSAATTEDIFSPKHFTPQYSTRTTHFSIEAGTDYLFGWKYTDTVEGRGFNPVLGMGVTHFFNKKWAIYSGIQYGSVTHLTATQKTFTTWISDFGASHTDSIIATRWIHYAVVPVFVQYHFGEKNFIGVGGSVAYLVNTTSDLIVNKYSDFKVPEQSKQTAGGYTEGFNQWNATVAMAYGRKITNRFSIDAEVHFGLLDIKDDAFFSRQKFERSTGIKLLLTYDLCNR